MAALQVVIIPCGVNQQNRSDLFHHCHALASSLSEAGLRAKADLREHYRPGWKFNEWELKVLLDVELRWGDLQLNLLFTVMSGCAPSTGDGAS